MPRCEKCGFRRRGPNHDDGVHHKTSPIMVDNKPTKRATGKATDHVKSKGRKRR